MPVAAIVSYRLGGADGVSVEAAKWAGALERLGFTVRRVAGEIEGPAAPGDSVVDGLAIDASDPPAPGAVGRAVEDAALVVLENVCSLPLNPAAARAVAAAAAGHRGRVVLHHHDLPWQRRHLAHFEREFPPRVDGALHAVINHRSRRELQARGFGRVVTVPNRFDFDAPLGDRATARAALGFDGELVLFQPARAIERKNVPGGLRFAARLQQLLPDHAVRYWLAGPAEDGYGPVLDQLLARAPVPMRVGRCGSVADAYAASDVVVFPSTWEGFGNPTLESVWARKPLAVHPYPVLGEIVACGLRFFPLSEPEAVASFVRAPDETMFDVNLRRARLSFSIDDLPADLDAAFRAAGWSSW